MRWRINKERYDPLAHFGPSVRERRSGLRDGFSFPHEHWDIPRTASGGTRVNRSLFALCQPVVCQLDVRDIDIDADSSVTTVPLLTIARVMTNGPAVLRLAPCRRSFG